MAVRLVVTFTSAPGKGAELARAYRDRCPQIMQEPGCEQFEVFQSVLDPDGLNIEAVCHKSIEDDREAHLHHRL